MIASGLSPSSRVGRARVLSTEIGGRLVLMGEAKGNYVSLDPTGSQIWQRLEPPRTVAALCEDLGVLYDVDPPVLERDVITFLENMCIQGLVEIVAGQPVQPPRRSGHVAIDDFLNPQEHTALLAGASTPASQGLAFGATAAGRRFQNRLLMWLPLLTKTLGVRMFALDPIESRLDASDDNATDLKPSWELAPADPQGITLTCVYDVDGAAANRLLVSFGADRDDVVPVRGPSNTVSERRLVVTTWLRPAPRLDPTRRFGLGHFRCAVVAPQFAGFDVSQGPS